MRKFDKTYKIIMEKINFVDSLSPLILEATKLSKKEEAISDPKELQPLIQKYEDMISGKKVLKNAKTGQPLSINYCKERLKLLKKKLQSLQQNNQTSNQQSNQILNHAVSEQEVNNISKEDDLKARKNGLCVYCKKPIKEGARFCGNCGKPIRRCYNCKKRVGLTSKFCQDCGEKLSDETTCEICGAKVSVSDNKCKECGHNLIKQNKQSYSLDEFKQLAEKISNINNKKIAEFKQKHLQKMKNLLEKKVSNEEYQKALNEWDSEYKKLANENTERFDKFTKKWQMAINALTQSKGEEKIKKYNNYFEKIEANAEAKATKLEKMAESLEAATKDDDKEAIKKQMKEMIQQMVVKNTQQRIKENLK